MKLSGNCRVVNLATNVLAAMVGATLVSLLAYQVTVTPSPNAQEAQLLKSGDTFRGLPEENFAKSAVTILLAMDVRCQYSNSALPFYKKIVAMGKENSSLRIIALFASKNEEVEQYLRENDFEIDFIADVDWLKLRIDATPTVVWVDANRKIVASYQGLLQENQVTGFLKELEGNYFAINMRNNNFRTGQ